MKERQEIPPQIPAFLRSWLTSERFIAVSRILVIEYILGLSLWFALADGYKDRAGIPIGADFINVFAAGFMVLKGQAPAVYDWSAHGAVQKEILHYDAAYFGWHYPPFFLILATLLALLPYFAALAVYTIAGFSAYWAVARRIGLKTKAFFWGIAAFPGAFINLSNGQNGFITTALLGSGFLFLEKRPWIAGALFGLLSYKPQFFVVIPVLLLAGGYGRALAATILSALACAAASLALFGIETWQAFFKSTELTRRIVVENGQTGWEKIQSVFSLAREMGSDLPIAYGLQIFIGLAALGLAAWLWRQKESTLAARATVLIATTALVTPYILDYDLIILAVPLVFLARQGLEKGFLPYEKLLLITLWFLPLIVRIAAKAGAPLTPFMMATMLGFYVTHAQSPRKKEKRLP